MKTKPLPEDPRERRMFNDATKLSGNNPLMNIARTMEIYGKMSPVGGSLREQYFIMANECCAAAELIKDLKRTLRRQKRAFIGEVAEVG